MPIPQNCLNCKFENSQEKQIQKSSNTVNILYYEVRLFCKRNYTVCNTNASDIIFHYHLMQYGVFFSSCSNEYNTVVDAAKEHNKQKMETAGCP